MIWKVKESEFSFRPKYFLGYWPFIVTTKLKGIAKFSSACLNFVEGEDKWDISKLVGFSSGMHHTNSCRIGWRSIEGKIELHAYCYYNGKRMTEYITSVNPGDEINWCILKKDNKWFIYINSEECIMPAAGPNIGYILNPYFGGTSPAPSIMRIILVKK